MPGNNSKHSALKVISINVDGFSSAKIDIIAKICCDEACHVLCLQETHQGPNSVRPCILGMKLAIESPHEQYGSAIFANFNITIESTSSNRVNIKLLTTNLRGITVTSVYKPPTVCFSSSNIVHNDVWVMIGDFNSHSSNWDYDVMDDDEDLVESWADSNHLSLIHDPKLPCSFYSGWWKRGYNPDIDFVSHNIALLTSKRVLDPIPHKGQSEFQKCHHPEAHSLQVGCRSIHYPHCCTCAFLLGSWVCLSCLGALKTFE